MHVSKILAAAVVLGAASFTTVPTAQAAPLMVNPAVSGSTVNAEPVQYRRGPGFRQGGHYYHGSGYNRGHRGYGYRGYNRGYGVGPALGGLAAGAIIGGAIAGSQARASGGDAVAYCSQRFRSYDPASGTYLGYDGNRHACP